MVSACQDYPVDNANVSQGITISNTDPGYWQYNGKNTLLLGGSSDDNLFQTEDLTEELDALKACGGNYVRNTMSSRDSGNVWPFFMTAEGLYDLDKWNEKYWERFERFLKMTDERDIIVQIELWATFDFYREHWKVNPFNPGNNNNLHYDTERSKLPLEVPTHPVFANNNFFRSVPSQMALFMVLWYQNQFVEKLLSYSLQYDHILYCMDNETAVTSDWGRYWSLYIQKQADIKGKKAHTTEM